MASGVLDTRQTAEVQTERGPVVYQDIRTDADMFGASIGRAISDAASTIGAIAAETRQKQETNAVMDVYAEGKNALRKELYDPKTGYYTQTGGNAVGGLSRVQKFSDDFLKSAMDKLPTQRAKDAFRKMWINEADTTLDGVARYEKNEAEQYNKQLQVGIVQSSIDNAVSSYNDPKIISKSMDDIRRVIRANSSGAPLEVVKQAETDAISTLHLNVIQRLAVDNPTAAAKYYKDNVGQIAGKDHTTAAKLLEPGIRKAQVNNLFNQITGTGKAANDLADVVSQVPGRGLIGAVVSAESGGHAYAISGAGAAGLMQVMPGTARDIASQLGDNRFDGMSDAQIRKVMMSDKALNVAYGAFYLQQQLNRYGGDVEATLVAYNAGPGNADKWLKAGRDYSVLPKPRETKPYVEKVLSRFNDAVGGSGGGAADARTSVNLGGLPKAGQVMTRNNWDLKFFKPYELMSPTPGGQWVEARSAKMLDAVASNFFNETGIRITVNDKHDFNAKPGSANPGKRRGTADPGDNPHVRKSQHLRGTAFDVQIQGLTDDQKTRFLTMARQAGFTGVGFYEGGSGHLHLDTGRERTWGAIPKWAQGALRTRAGVGGGTTIAAPGGAQAPDASPLRSGAGGQGGAPVAVQSPVAVPQGNDGTVALNSITTVDTAAPDYEMWMAQADSIDDPDVREALKRKLGVEKTRRESFLKKDTEKNENEAWGYVMNGGLDTVPPELKAKLGHKFLRDAMLFESQIAKNGKVKTDYGKYYKLNRMTDEQLKDVNLMDYRPYLDDGKLDEMMRRQNEAINKKPSEQTEIKGLRTRNQIVDDTMNTLGWNKKPEKVGKLDEILDGKIKDFYATNNKSPDATQIQEMVDRLVIHDKNTWWGEGDTLTETEKKDLSEFEAANKVEDIPDEDLSAVVNHFTSFNDRAPNQDEAVKIYNNAIRAYVGGPVELDGNKKILLVQAFTKAYGRAPTDEEIQKKAQQYYLGFLKK